MLSMLEKVNYLRLHRDIFCRIWKGCKLPTEVWHLTRASHSILSILAAGNRSAPECHASFRLSNPRIPFISLLIISRRCWHPAQAIEQQKITRNLEVKPHVPAAASTRITSYLSPSVLSNTPCVYTHKTEKRLWELNPNDLIYKINERTKLKQQIGAFKNSFSEWISLGFKKPDENL